MASRADDQVIDSTGGTQSAECSSFQNHFADLYESIQNPTTLAVRLFTADLLSRETRKRICSRAVIDSDKVTEILDAVETMIRLDSSNFYKFVEELGKESSMQHLCGKSRSTCGECNKNVCLS